METFICSHCKNKLAYDERCMLNIIYCVPCYKTLYKKSLKRIIFFD